MKKLLEDIYIIEGIGNANVFLLKSSDGFILIDSGIFKQTHLLIAQIKENGFHISELKTIVLTHCHCDHIGGVTELVKHSEAKVAAHKDDIPYITQEKIILGAYHDMMAEEQKVMKQFGCNVRQVDIVLNDGDVIDIHNGLQVISVPGHTPGSIALYQANEKIMFFGDVIRNNPKRGLTIGIPEKFNFSTEQTMYDTKKILNYSIEYALFSHGSPILENAEKYLKEIIN